MPEFRLSATAPDSANADGFRVVAETDDVLVVDKPAFLLIHPTRPDGRRTLWSEVRNLLAFEIANGGQVSIVNRLDRETSGLVLIAKSAMAARQFGMLMQQQLIAKEYLAIVRGWPKWDRRVVDAPLLRQGSVSPSAIFLKQAIHRDGANAITEFQVVERFRRGAPFSIIRAVPRTGRTHQIRVHLSAVGHPVVGDKIYGPDEQCYLEFIKTGWTSALRAKLLLPRHALHSARLTVPGFGDWQSELPADLSHWMREGV